MVNTYGAGPMLGDCGPEPVEVEPVVLDDAMGLWRWTRALLRLTTSKDETRPRASSWLRLMSAGYLGRTTHNSCQVISRVLPDPGEVSEYSA
jgi:hypothetical protein